MKNPRDRESRPRVASSTPIVKIDLAAIKVPKAPKGVKQQA